MRIGKVIGTVTLNRSHPSLGGACYRVVAPLAYQNVLEASDPTSEELVVYDDLGAGPGSLIAFSEGAEAAQPFYPEMKPIDSYNAAILDSIDVRAAETE